MTDVNFEDLTTESVTGEQLKRLTGLSEDLTTIRDEISEMEAALKAKKKEEFKLSSDRIPQYMNEIGMKTFSLTNGESVEITDHVKASVKKENKPRAYKFLMDNEAGDLIKHTISLKFGMSEEESSTDALKILKEGGFDPSDELNVHPSSLKAWVKRQLEAGKNIDHELFGVFEYSQTKITQPKKRRF